MSDPTATPCHRPRATPVLTGQDRASPVGFMRWVTVAQWVILLALGVSTIWAWIAFCSYIPLFWAVINKTVILFLFVLLIFPLLYGVVGRGLGINSLFWHDHPLTRFNAAVAVTVYLAIVATLMFLSYKIDPESPNDLWGKAELCDPSQFPAQFQAFLVLLGVPALALVLAPAVVPSWFAYVPHSAPRSPLNRHRAGNRPARPLDVTRDSEGWIFGFAVWVTGVLFGVLIIGSLEWVGFSILKNSRYYHFNFYISLALLFLAVYVFFGSLGEKAVSPPVAICALLAFLAFSYAAFDDLPDGVADWLKDSLQAKNTYAPLWRAAILIVLLFYWWAVNQDEFKLRFPNMGHYYDSRHTRVKLRERVEKVYIRENRAIKPPAQAGDDSTAELVCDEEVLNNWLRKVTKKDPEVVKKLPICERPKLALVAVSGGATRSAIWTAVVLDRVEQMIPTFRQHLRIITGASGGMLGAAYFLKDCRANPSGHSTCQGQPSPWVNKIPLASIGPVASFIAMRDVWRALLPRRIFSLDDRGIQLEKDWKDIRFALQELVAQEKAGDIPSMILSPMIVEDGRRLLISNLDLWDMTLVRGSALTFDDPGSLDYPYSLSALEFFRLFPKAKHFRLTTGVRMSASFPYVSPAVNLPTDPPRRVVDAGYYDNYGVQVATAWVQKNRVWLDGHTSGVVLVQIRDSISQKDRLDVADAPTGLWAWFARSFRFFTSPVDGVVSARYASTIFRNDQDVWELSNLFDLKDPLHTNPNEVHSRPLDRGFFTTVAFENSADVTTSGHASGSWPGDDPIDGESGDVALDWYLSDAEKAGLIGAIPPKPESGSCWFQDKCRRARIEELTKMVHFEKKELVRDKLLKQLEQAKNYERLVVLKEWWDNPKSGEYRPPSTTAQHGDGPDPVTPRSVSDATPAPERNQLTNNEDSVMDLGCGITGCPYPVATRDKPKT